MMAFLVQIKFNLCTVDIGQYGTWRIDKLYCWFISGNHLSGWHHILGAAMLVAMIVQPTLGALAHRDFIRYGVSCISWS